MKNKKIYPIFAVFASFLILMTPTVISTTQEQTNMESIQEIELYKEITKEPELFNQILQLGSDKEINSLLDQFADANTEGKNSIINEVGDTIKEKPEYSEIEEYIGQKESDCSLCASEDDAELAIVENPDIIQPIVVPKDSMVEYNEGTETNQEGSTQTNNPFCYIVGVLWMAYLILAIKFDLQRHWDKVGDLWNWLVEHDCLE